MPAASFGRKGLGESEELARRKAAFIAAERERAAQHGDSAPETDETEWAAPRPASRPTHHAKSLARAYMSWLFGGSFGSHRFYLGAYQTAIAQGSLCVFGWLMVFLGDNAGGADVLATLGPYAAGAGTLWVAYDGFTMRGLREKMEERARIAKRHS